MSDAPKTTNEPRPQVGPSASLPIPSFPTPPVPSDDDTGKSFWQSYPGKLAKWAVEVFIITALFMLISWGFLKLGLPAPVPSIQVQPTPVVQEMPQPPMAVESPTQFYCGRVETLSDNITTRPWPVKKLTWNLSPAGYRGTISAFRLKEAFVTAWASWSARVDVTPEFSEDASTALIVIKFGDIDGSGRVLAWSELADGTTTPKQQLYDAGERWEIESQPSQIDLVRVAAHELGHVLGLVHDSEDSGSLMAPIYSRSIRFPTERDIKRLLAMGYPVKPVPPGSKPQLPPINITIDTAQIFAELEKAGYEIRKKQ